VRIPGDYNKILGTYDKNNMKIIRIDKINEVRGKKDVVSISEDARDYQLVQKALRDIPDMRDDKVRELEQKYSNGSYDVSGAEIADSIIKRFIDRKV
jgi:negative regulator of flagellin synthesis FlgM